MHLSVYVVYRCFVYIMEPGHLWMLAAVKRTKSQLVYNWALPTLMWRDSCAKNHGEKWDCNALLVFWYSVSCTNKHDKLPYKCFVMRHCVLCTDVLTLTLRLFTLISYRIGCLLSPLAANPKVRYLVIGTILRFLRQSAVL